MAVAVVTVVAVADSLPAILLLSVEADGNDFKRLDSEDDYALDDCHFRFLHHANVSSQARYQIDRLWVALEGRRRYKVGRFHRVNTWLCFAQGLGQVIDSKEIMVSRRDVMSAGHFGADKTYARDW